MAKSKVVEIQTVQCSICKESIALTEYPKHISDKHSSSAPPPSSQPSVLPRAMIPNTPIPGGPQGNSQGQGPLGGGPRPMTGPINAGDYAGTPYLKGSDLPDGTNEVKCRVQSWVYIPGQRSPLACQIDKVYGKEYLGINKTNVKQLMSFGYSEFSVLVGKVLVLGIYPVPNPTTGQMTKGLWITRVE